MNQPKDFENVNAENDYEIDKGGWLRIMRAADSVLSQLGESSDRRSPIRVAARWSTDFGADSVQCLLSRRISGNGELKYRLLVASSLTGTDSDFRFNNFEPGYIYCSGSLLENTIQADLDMLKHEDNEANTLQLVEMELTQLLATATELED